MRMLRFCKDIVYVKYYGIRSSVNINIAIWKDRGIVDWLRDLGLNREALWMTTVRKICQS